MKKQRLALHLLLGLMSAQTICNSPLDSDSLDQQAAQETDIESLVNYQAPRIFDESIERTGRTRKRRRRGGYSHAESILGEIFTDIITLNRNLFLWNTFKVISTTFPIFVGARMIDEKLQNCFYDPRHHKNCNQMPSWCHTAAKISIGIPIVVLGLQGLLSKDVEDRYTSQIMLLGMPFVIWTKTLVKMMKFDACLRPWNEKFSCEQRSYGGFPSGHMAQAMYVAVLYGTRFGPRYSIPLGALAGFLGVTFVTCNRHYISQIIGGAAFGTMYALAADKLVSSKLTERVKLGFKFDDRGAPTFSLAFNF